MSLHSAEVVILAGGASRRMGSPKALLHFASGKDSPSTRATRDTQPTTEYPETFLDHLLTTYREAGIERATVIWPESARRDARVLHSISNPQTISLKTRHVFHDDPAADRLASVLLGLRQTEESSGVFLQDVDRPFVTAAVIRALLQVASTTEDGYVAPDVFGHAGHPLLLTPSAVHTLLEACVKATQKARMSPQCLVGHPPITLRDLLLPLHGTLVTVGSMEEAFFLSLNINTPTEYRRFFAPGEDGELSSLTLDERHAIRTADLQWRNNLPQRVDTVEGRSTSYAS